MRARPGQGLVEYVLIVAVVALGLIGALVIFRNVLWSEVVAPVNERVECASPGQGGANPGHGGGTPRGQCQRQAS